MIRFFVNVFRWFVWAMRMQIRAAWICPICEGRDDRCVPREDLKLVKRWGPCWIYRCSARHEHPLVRPCAGTVGHDGMHLDPRGDGAVWP